MIGAGRVLSAFVRPACRDGWRWFSFSGCLKLAQFVAVFADGGFPLRAAIDEVGASDLAFQRADTFGLGDRCQGGNASSLAGLNPCLPQGPCEALAANVSEFDLRIFVGLAEDGPGSGHDDPTVDFGHSSAGR